MDNKIITASRPGVTAAAAALPPGRLAARQALPIAVITALLWLGWDRLAGLDTGAIAQALGAMTAVQWLSGLAFTGVSFWAVGHYDAVVHRLSGTGIGPRAAVETGATAIAVAQTIGMGTLTGALVRWRLLPGLGLAGAMRLSVAVSLSFLTAWAVLAALALIAVPLPLPVARPLVLFGAGTLVAAAAALALVSLIRPGAFPAAATRHLPSLRAMATVLGLTALDTFAAGTVLWVLLPDTPGLGAPQVLAAYLLALGAGLVLTTPGGIGPFEAALLALLPDIGSEPLLAAVIAYRALYYALPAMIGGLVLIRGPRRAAARPAGPTSPALVPLPAAPHLPPLVDATIDRAPRAEAALLRHGRLSLATERGGRPIAMVAPTGQSLAMLSDPLSPDADPAETLSILAALARDRMRVPVLYKAGARLAATARARGWRVSAIAREAWLDPRGFTAEGSARSGLRRKLRKAEAAGITVAKADPQALPLAEMAEIAAAWAAAHGGERGFSMGTWAPDTLPWARVYLARDPGNRLLGFVTVHANTREHTLDLMRARADAPDGLMYLLLAHAIETAGAAGVPRFSFAAVPVPPSAADPAPLRFLRDRLETASGGAGLRQFKQAFAPHWETLYIAAPGLPALAAGALDIAREIATGRPPGG
ncbi:MAG: DUF2156 domain-containing protein [Maritimibacter sp.]|nr:DUF2156 domain-containing protein [Maritimibacter sp.]